MSSSENTTNQFFPKIYKIFKAKDKNSENLIELKIHDLLPSDYDKAVEIIYDTIKDEPLSVSRKILKYEDTMNLKRKLWRSVLDKGMSIGCYKEDGELIGLNVLAIAYKGEELNVETQDRNLLDSIELTKYTSKKADVFNRYNVDKYLTSMGLCVNSEYRGRRIATELLKVRPQIMKNLELTLSVTTFTSVGAQSAAKSAGFEDVYVVRYEDLKKVSPNLDFVNGISEYLKIMALRI